MAFRGRAVSLLIVHGTGSVGRTRISSSISKRHNSTSQNAPKDERDLVLSLSLCIAGRPENVHSDRPLSTSVTTMGFYFILFFNSLSEGLSVPFALQLNVNVFFSSLPLKKKRLDFSYFCFQPAFGLDAVPAQWDIHGGYKAKKKETEKIC